MPVYLVTLEMVTLKMALVSQSVVVFKATLAHQDGDKVVSRLRQPANSLLWVCE